MRKRKSHSRVVATFALALVLFASWFALPARYQQLLDPTAFAAAMTFTVDTGSDGADVNPGDGICDMIPGAGFSCSLRAAIQESNANIGKDTINFNFAGSGVRTLGVLSPLPTITDPVIIDGYSQPGASVNTLPNGGNNAVLLIQLQGSNLGGSGNGLTITAGNSTVKGLVINLFPGSAIELDTNGGNTIQGNFIGTDPAGTLAPGNFSGIAIGNSNTNTIGGLTADKRNLISGNKIGVQITSGTGNMVQGNLIGTDAAGTGALGNNAACDCGAVRVFATDTIIGGTTPGARNVISGNGKYAVEIGTDLTNFATGTKVQGNFIGTDIGGNAPLGNGKSGVTVANASDTTIGGVGNAGNTIAFNARDGVTVVNNPGASILSNSIFSNNGLGIDLGGSGVTPNDLKDLDGLQNFPVVTSAAKSGDNVLISGTLNSTPNTSFTIELFSNSTCDPTGNGEGQKLINLATATTDSNGDASFITADLVSNLIGSFITATATDPDGNTSEFSQCTQLSTPLPVVQFGQPTYSAFEDCTAVTVTVAREGDTSNAAAVDYATQPGTANDRADFNTAIGTINFAPGETAKAFDILISEDSFSEGTENFTVALSNAAGATLGSPATATIQIFDDLTEPATNPIDTADNFVCQHYHDFLNREDDSSGLAFWTNNITSCGTDAACIQTKRIDTSAAFFLSFEFQETGGFVIRVQRVAFGKKSSEAATRISYNQFIRDARQVGEGVVVGQPGFDVRIGVNEQTYATQVVTSAPFVSAFPLTQTADQYVDALFASAGVTPAAAERQAAINAFGGGGTAGRTAALRSVSDSNSVGLAEFTPTFVLMQYFGYLRRNPTDAPDNNDSGYQFWLTKLNNFNGDFRRSDMVKAFIASGEYRSRFGQP
jgi:CSLREA domain-containing protein